MIYAFYFRLYRVFRNEKISTAFSIILNCLYRLRFQLKKLFLRRRTVQMTSEKAEEIVRNTWPDPELRPDYCMKEPDEAVFLSVIIPVYNYLDLVPECIESVLAQKTKYRFEVILVDDGSTDGTERVLSQYENYPDVYVIRQENRGIGAARNTGISLARGRYLMFVDCDDTVRPEIVDNLLSCALRTGSDIVMCAHERVKYRDGKAFETVPNVYPSANLLRYRNHDEIMNYAGLPWAKVYRRELFEQVRFFPGYRNEDTIVHMLLFTQSEKFTYLPWIGYEYRWYENNFSHIQGDNKNVRAAEYIWLLRAIAEHYTEIGMPDDAKFYTALLNHVSFYYYPKIAGLEEETVEALFIMGRDLLLSHKPQEKVALPYMLRISEKAILEKDIELWKLASLNQ